MRVNQDDELTSDKEAKVLYSYGRIVEITFASWKDRETLDESITGTHCHVSRNKIQEREQRYQK